MRVEDGAYCLMGLFAVNMPLIYGEGYRAWDRLRDEIRRRFPDDNLGNAYEGRQRGNDPYLRSLRRRVEQLQGTRPPPDQGSPSDAPGEPSMYTSSRLNDPSSFRIFVLCPGVFGSRIEGRIEVHSLLDPPAYHALSYVWGQEPELHQIMVNDFAITIRPNLFNALQRIRLTIGELPIWIDSLCINQRDYAERGDQVAQMATIYSKANGVLVWLGEEDASSTHAIEFVSEIVKDEFPWTSDWWAQYSSLALSKLLERPWFRRGWVLQEAAFSLNTMVRCGDRELHMEKLAMAIHLIRGNTPAISSHAKSASVGGSSDHLAAFRESPAVRLIETIDNGFVKDSDGQIIQHRLCLETLVDLGTFSETSDPRDAIYALLSLANDTPPQIDDDSLLIAPDYSKNVLDIFAEFVEHCCLSRRSLDIICRPWAPVVNFAFNKSKETLCYPSWIRSRDGLPFGTPTAGTSYRVHGRPLTHGCPKRAYNAHDGTGPEIRIGRSMVNGPCDGSLRARGRIIGEVTKRSARLASGIITKEAIDILGSISRRSESDLIHVPDEIWRTLCADRNNVGEPAQMVYKVAMIQLLQSLCRTEDLNFTQQGPQKPYSIDIEELLDGHMPQHIHDFLVTVREIIWNRRTFAATLKNSRMVVGLMPPLAKLGDHICVLYGCSVPVVLRKMSSAEDSHAHWQLIGDAYVHGIMNGETMRDSANTPIHDETTFEIR